MERIGHLSAPLILIGLAWLALALGGLWLWWSERKKR